MGKARRGVILAGLVGLAGGLCGAAPGTGSSDLGPGSAPSVTNQLREFSIEPGFRIEVVAAPPLIGTPAALAFDENGRLFVAEMGDPPGGAQASHSGVVRRLERADGSNVFTTSTVYADNLAWPSALACYGGGLFVACTPDILYLKDTSGNGVADVRKVVFSGFGGATNPPNAQALLTSFQWGLDNRIHGLTAGIGGIVTALSAPGAGPVSLRGSDFSFDPRALTITPEAGPAQSGLAFDDRGRKFVCDPGRPLRTPMYQRRYVARNPFFARPGEVLEVASPATPIFEFASPGQINTGGALSSSTPPLPKADERKGLTPAWLMNACGLAIYRGSAFPSNYFGGAFVADPEAHVVHRAVLSDSGLEWVAERAGNEPRTEFLASRDARFRPMQVVNGPEGALYIADQRGGHGDGRIYRIVPRFYAPGKLARLGKYAAYGLVATLASNNGWQGDTAERLLYERREPGGPALLTNMVLNSHLAPARLHALHALDGLGALNEPFVLAALQDTDEWVREHAVLLAEKALTNGSCSDALWQQLTGLVLDPAIRVRYQLAFSLGEIQRPERPQVLADLLRRESDNPWMRAAVFSSLRTGGAEVLARLARDEQFRSSATGQQVLAQLAEMIGVSGQEREIGSVVDFLASADPELPRELDLLYALGDGLKRDLNSLGLADPKHQLVRFWPEAEARAGTGWIPESLRLPAVRLLGVAPVSYGDVAGMLAPLLEAGQSPALQSAGIATFGRFDDPGVVTNLLARWRTFTPVLRQEALNALLGRAAHIGSVMDALENGRIATNDLSSVQIDFLRSDRNESIRRRAVDLFGAPVTERPETVVRWSSVLHLSGAPENGREIFIARCAACHQLGGEGYRLGPDLVGAKVHGQNFLLSALLQPNAAVRPGFEARVVEMKTGETVVGLVTDENLATLTVSQPGGVRTVWPRANVRSVQTQSWSLMPVGLEAGLSPQDLADLLGYIMATPR